MRTRIRSLGEPTRWRAAAVLVGAAIVAALVSVAGSSPTAAAAPLTSPAQSTHLTVAIGSPFRTVPRSFVGLSFEYWDLPRYAGTEATPQAAFLNLLQGLDPGGGEPPQLRFGGGSADASWWNPSGAPQPPGIGYDLNWTWLHTLQGLLKASGAKALLTLNLATGDTATAVTEARAMRQGLSPGQLGGFEVGNEPDNYAGQWISAASGNRLVRPSSYNFDDYLADLTRYSRALAAANLGVPAAATSFASFKWLYPSRLGDIDTANGSGQPLLTWQRYPLVSCGSSPGDPSYPTIGQLLAPATENYMVSNFALIAARATSVGKVLRISEFNSVGCGGAPGVSNTYATALWSLRAFFDLATVGVNGVNVHNMHGVDYSPILADSGPGTSALHVGPIYYGMRMFAEATQHGAALLSVTTTAGSPVQVYATRDRDGIVRVVLLNLTSSAAGLAVNAGLAPTATTELLTAPSLAATSGISIGGQSYGSSTDGLLHGQSTVSSLARGPAGYPVTVPANSAVLLTVPRA